MTLTKTFPTDRAAGLPLADTRLLVAAMVESDTTGKPRAGVLPSHYNPLVTGTTGMAYSVAAFAAVTARAGMGAELVANDGAATVATTAAPGANSRIDVIWVRSLFTTTSDAGTDPVFGVTQGTAAPSPSKPSIPPGALELATAVILSTTTQTSTAVVTQTHPYTAMEGGAVALRNQAEMDAWAPADGSRAFRIDMQTEFLMRGGQWQMHGGGMRLIVPTSVVGATVSRDGTVSPINGATRAQLDGVFSPMYRVYVVDWSMALNAAAATILRLTRGGAAYTAAGYSAQRISASGSGVTASAQSGVNGWSGAAVSAPFISGRYEFKNPQHQGPKFFTSDTQQAPGQGLGTDRGWLGSADSLVFDGFEFTCGSPINAGDSSFFKVYGVA